MEGVLFKNGQKQEEEDGGGGVGMGEKPGKGVQFLFKLALEPWRLQYQVGISQEFLCLAKILKESVLFGLESSD